MPSRIIVTGSVNVDVSIRMPRLPVAGETLKGNDVVLCLGGKGANQAIAAARLGGNTHFHAALGTDEFAAFARNGLEREPLAQLILQQVTSRSTGIATILIAADGQNMIALSPGANTAFSGAAVSAEFRSEDILLLQNETSAEANLLLAKAMRRAGGTVILDPAPADGISDELLRLTDLITPNESEAAALLGQPLADAKSTASAATLLCERGARAAIIKLGSNGSLLHVPEAGSRWGAAVTQHISTPAVQAVDTVAAGDCFNGALAVALAEGRSLLEACQFASAAAAFSVTRRGASASLPTRAELEAFVIQQRPSQ
jgi:ribokinase